MIFLKWFFKNFVPKKQITPSLRRVRDRNVTYTKQISGETIILKTGNSVHLFPINLTREIKQNTLVIWYSTRRDVEPMGRALYKLNKFITKNNKIWSRSMWIPEPIFWPSKTSAKKLNMTSLYKINISFCRKLKNIQLQFKHVFPLKILYLIGRILLGNQNSFYFKVYKFNALF